MKPEAEALARGLARVHQYRQDGNVAGLMRELDSELSRGTLSVAGRAARGLAAMDERRALPLVRALVTSEIPGVRFGALVAMKEFADLDGLSIAAQATTDPVLEVRSAAVGVLSSISGPESSDALLRVAEADQDERLRFQAAKALVARETPAVRDLIEQEISRKRDLSWFQRRNACDWERLLPAQAS